MGWEGKEGGGGGGRRRGGGDGGVDKRGKRVDSGGIPSIKLLFSGQETSIRASMRNGLQCPASVDNTAQLCPVRLYCSVERSCCPPVIQSDRS